VILGVDGYSDFNALHSGKHNEEVRLCAFDVLAVDGDDLRDLPLSLRKTNSQRLLARWPDGIFVAPFDWSFPHPQEKNLGRSRSTRLGKLLRGTRSKCHA
jgi:hypothetical protein